MLPLPDLTAYSVGGITLVLAVYLVLQALKRSHPGLKKWMVEIVIALAAVLVATALWYMPAFLFLAGTLLTAALIITAHGGVKNVAGAKDKQE